MIIEAFAEKINGYILNKILLDDGFIFEIKSINYIMSVLG